MNLLHELAKVKGAASTLATLSDEKVNAILKDVAVLLLQEKNSILTANQEDLSRMDPSHPEFDRLLLNEDRLQGMAKDLENVAKLPCPLGEVLEERTLPNLLELKKIRVPLGVIAVIYEARPNVTLDVFSLCFKTGNACILKAGKEAYHSSKALVELVHRVLQKHAVDPAVAFLMPAEREYVTALLTAREFVDVVIPRGGKGLIDFVVQNATVPVIETGAGIVHTYVDQKVDLQKAVAILHNAKTRRPSVCNSLDTLLIHEKQLPHLETLVNPLAEKAVEIFADSSSFKVLQGKYAYLSPAQEDHFGTEFLSLKMSIKTVKSIEEAVAHINHYGSKHSEAILSEDPVAIEYFFTHVDAAAVYSNTSTAFTDGAQFGLGAEIGISTQKLHARGPMGLKELTSTKWLVKGNGQIRT